VPVPLPAEANSRSIIHLRPGEHLRRGATWASALRGWWTDFAWQLLAIMAVVALSVAWHDLSRRQGHVDPSLPMCDSAPGGGGGADGAAAVAEVAAYSAARANAVDPVTGAHLGLVGGREVRCTPCDPRGECTQGRMTCPPGTVARSAVCVEDESVAIAAFEIASEQLRGILEDRRGQFECGWLPEGARASLTVAELDRSVRSLPQNGDLAVRGTYAVAFGRALDILRDRSELWGVIFAGPRGDRAAESVTVAPAFAYKPLACQLGESLRAYAWLLAVLLVAAAVAVALWLGWRRRAFEARLARKLVQEVKDILQHSARKNNGDQGSTVDSMHIMHDLREKFVAKDVPEATFERTWAECARRVARDSRIGKAGPGGHMWSWDSSVDFDSSPRIQTPARRRIGWHPDVVEETQEYQIGAPPFHANPASVQRAKRRLYPDPRSA
jgi:hypothetical protein